MRVNSSCFKGKLPWLCGQRQLQHREAESNSLPVKPVFLPARKRCWLFLFPAARDTAHLLTVIGKQLQAYV